MTFILDASLYIATLLTLIGLAAACGRLFLGPSRADRVVALDLITVLLVAIAALAALRFDDGAYLDLGLTLALIGFLATVAFARYVEMDPVSGPEPSTGDADERDGPPTDDLSRNALPRSSSSGPSEDRLGGSAGDPSLGQRP